MKIKNGNIYIKRGEGCTMKVCVKVNGEPYKMQFADRIQLLVKRSMLDSEKSIIERTSIGSDVIRIKSADTANLVWGKYRYEVRLIKSDGDVHILIGPNDFNITGGNT